MFCLSVAVINSGEANDERLAAMSESRYTGEERPLPPRPMDEIYFWLGGAIVSGSFSFIFFTAQRVILGRRMEKMKERVDLCQGELPDREQWWGHAHRRH